MAFSSGLAGPIDKNALEGRRKGWIVLCAALLCFAGALVTPSGMIEIGLLAVGMTLMLVAAWLGVVAHGLARAETHALSHIATVLDDDAVPSFLCGMADNIFYHNRAAATEYDLRDQAGLADVLQTVLADPDGVVQRVRAQAAQTGSDSTTLRTRRGKLRMMAHRAGANRFLWRIERFPKEEQPKEHMRTWPKLRLSADNTLLYANDAARDLIGTGHETLAGVNFASIRSGQLLDLPTQDGDVACLVFEADGTGENRELLLVPGIDIQPRQPDGWAFFDEIPVPLLKLARSGEIELFNRLARDLLGAQIAKGKSFDALTEGLGRSIAEWLDDAAMHRGTIQPEIVRVKRPDREVFVQVTLNRVMEEDTISLIAVLSDATKLKSLEAQFVQSQKMQAIGQLAGGVAHDFNNLLTAISGHCDLLLLRHDPGDPDYGDLVQINQNANRAAALVGQLLAYSRKQTLRPEVIDMRDTLADLTHLLNRLVGEKVSLKLMHDPDLAKIRADKRQLEQVIMNLVVNARDAMRGAGEIRIVTQNFKLDAPLKRDRVEVAPGAYVCITVMDEGHGIPEDKLQKVFEPFFTTKRVGEGTGLGLSTAYGIVKQSGGFIFVDSALDRGTAFQILLPAYECEEPVAEVAPPKPLAPVKQMSGVVLLVEDEAPVRAFASRALQLRGFTVLEAESAEDALDLLQDQALSVDVFVTDVIMPGIDGPSWVQQALQARPHVKVVFMSGYAEETFAEAQSKIPNSVFLPKPFSLVELTETVQRQMA